MSPSPKTPEENKQKPEDDPTSTNELSHPTFHLQHEYIASTDDSLPNSDDDNPNNANEPQGDLNGYCLLPQESDLNQQDETYDSDNEDQEFLRFATLRAFSSREENLPVNSSTDPTESIWSTKLESESFPVDDEKANYIKNLMSKIELPPSSIPTWAQLCSEEHWQEKLRERITCRQTTFFSEEKN